MEKDRQRCGGGGKGGDDETDKGRNIKKANGDVSWRVDGETWMEDWKVEDVCELAMGKLRTGK